MLDDKDYLARINKAKRKRNNDDNQKYLVIAAVVLLILTVVISVAAVVKNRKSGPAAGPVPEVETATPADAKASAISESEAEAQKIEDEKKHVVDSFHNMGLVVVEGYLNVRKAPSTDGDIIGKMLGGSACEIISEEGGWYQIKSGEVEGYISGEFVLTGDEAKKEAVSYVKEMAIVTTDNLNIRKEPVLDSSNIVGQALTNERYEVVGVTDGWVQVKEGYMSSDYVEIKYALDEARKMDLKSMAVNQYKNIVISKVSNYLNVRSSPEDKGTSNVIGKFPSNAAGEILETVDGWYKIQSGSITGYVTTDPQYTAIGQEAKDLAMSSASLMAIVRTDKLNVRNQPTTEGKLWTQISKEERYPVVTQLDGWVQIELDSGEENADAAYISTRDNNVEVRYALPEAIKFSPLEEKENQQASRRTQIVNYALQFVGNPYVWGGTSLTKGADCSGFVMSVLGHFGISLPHYSGSQAQMGRKVSSSEMRPGDLIFYANSGGTINHVAMYIGNGQIVHAASRRSGIKISTWNYRTPKTIRNVID
ncbi:SH3 domain-containing protein [Clostridium sp. MCC353]|uniref:C40 family peptidase n=1 Tax=Clostridium sp. MCC353 TaxID=2592646 RepID=UPI001C03138A|nr:C40 family peptidase [Clostridium sp. MCC353]MBT9779304.1 SH3 domain-containing protein [Clostridium sp. MCC353]